VGDDFGNFALHQHGDVLREAEREVHVVLYDQDGEWAKLHRHFAFGYYSSMQVVSGIVIDGKVVVEGLSLPEGTAVTVLARGDEAVVKLSPEEEADLLAALDEADREEGVPAAEFFERLRRFG
jgi:hypothetical protein